MLDADQIAALIGGVVAFLIVAGWAVVRWRAVGRDPTYTDDNSVLLAAPPPGMTAATATVIDGRPSQLALTAGLLDLASRDEIGFRDEDSTARKAHPIGIEIRGGTSDDPRIRLNRRRPVGDGEAWLLTMIRETIVERSAQGTPMRDRPDMQMDAMTAMVGFFGFEGHEASAGATDGPGGAFVGGMTSSIPDIETYLAGMEARSGKPMSDKTRASLSRMAPMLEALRNPDAVAADPDAFIDRMAASTGKQPTDTERAEMKAYIGRMVEARQRQMGETVPSVAAPVDPAAAMPMAASPNVAAAVAPGAAMSVGASPTTGQPVDPAPTPVTASPAVAASPPAALPYLVAAQAATFHPPLGFGTFLETYAKRHGWIASMSITRRLPWRALGLVEVVVGIVIAAVSGSTPSIGLGIGLGIAAGGVATWLIAPSMASKTMEGAMMKAQLAAYRRTLQATFTSAGIVDDSLKATGMSWLETPDQVLVWGVALGLRDEIADLLRRSASTAALGGSAGGGGSAAVVTELGIFEGIERIGTVVPPQHHSS